MAVEQLGSGIDDGLVMGRATSDIVSFYGTTPVSQRASSDFASTVSTVASSASFAAAQQAALNSVILGFNEIYNTLKALGLHKGAA